MAAQRVAGICFIKVGGTQYPLRGKLEYQPLSSKKESVVGTDGFHGYKETPIPPFIKFEFTDLGGISVQQLQDLNGVPVTAELANGKVITLRGAWLEGEITVDAVEGKYEGQFNGLAMDEGV